MKLDRAMIGLLLGIVGLAGCTSLYDVPYADAVHEGRKKLQSDEGLPVQGYVDAKEERHRWSGRAFLSENGSLTVRREDVEPETIRLPCRDVKALIVRKTDWKKVGGVGLGVLGAAAYAVGAALAGFAVLLGGV